MLNIRARGLDKASGPVARYLQSRVAGEAGIGWTTALPQPCCDRRSPWRAVFRIQIQRRIRALERGSTSCACASGSVLGSSFLECLTASSKIRAAFTAFQPIPANVRTAGVPTATSEATLPSASKSTAEGVLLAPKAHSTANLVEHHRGRGGPSPGLPPLCRPRRRGAWFSPGLFFSVVPM